MRRLCRDLISFRDKHLLDRVVVINVSSTEPVVAPRPEHADLTALRRALRTESGVLPSSALYAYAAFTELGEGVTGFATGDNVIGFTHDRASHAELVVVDADHLIHRPEEVSWEAAGALFVAGTTAYACVRAVGVGDGDVLAVSGAAGGVGSITVQLARHLGATVIGLASPVHHDWLREHDVIPVEYGDGVEARIRAASPGPIDAFIDTYGSGYVELAVALGVNPRRINTIPDFGAAGYVDYDIMNAASGNPTASATPAWRTRSSARTSTQRPGSRAPALPPSPPHWPQCARAEGVHDVLGAPRRAVKAALGALNAVSAAFTAPSRPIPASPDGRSSTKDAASQQVVALRPNRPIRWTDAEVCCRWRHFESIQFVANQHKPRPGH